MAMDWRLPKSIKYPFIQLLPDGLDCSAFGFEAVPVAVHRRHFTALGPADLVTGEGLNHHRLATFVPVDPNQAMLERV